MAEDDKWWNSAEQYVKLINKVDDVLEGIGTGKTNMGNGICKVQVQCYTNCAV